MPLDSQWDREVVDHHRRFFGDVPWRLHDYDPVPGDSERLYVLEFPPTVDGDYTVYATVGMSRLPMPGGEDYHDGHGHRAELLLHTRQPSHELADTLATLAHYPFARWIELGWTHTIAGTPGVGIVKGSPLTDILLGVPPWPAEFATIHHRDGAQTRMLLVVPLYPHERAFKIAHGADALTNRFQRDAIDLWDLWRGPYVAEEELDGEVASPVEGSQP